MFTQKNPMTAGRCWILGFIIAGSVSWSVFAGADNPDHCVDSLVVDEERSSIQSTLVIVGDNLYKDCQGHLLFQTRKTLVSLSETPQVVNLFLHNVVPTGDRRRGIEIPLDNVVDSANWRHVFEYLYRDDDSLFCLRPMSSGGTLFLLTDVDPKDFVMLRSGGTLDRFTLPELEAEVRNASSEVERARIFESISQYATTQDTVYFRCSELRAADVKTFHVTGKWEARDKDHQYLGDRSIPKEE